MRQCKNGTCDYFVDHAECSSYCQHNGVVRILTNAARIRAMSDEEVANLFVNAAADGCPPEMDWDCCKDEYGWDDCEGCWTKWLRAPACKEGE